MDIVKTCALCGKTYIGHSMSSMYCSSSCSCRAFRLKKKERLLESKEDDNSAITYNIDASSFIRKEYISMKELAAYLSVSRVTAYRYVVSGLIKGIRLGRNIFIRKSDIEASFNNAPEYKKRKYRRKDSASEYYTIKEIVEKYHICKKAVLNRCDKFNIPKVYEGRNVFFKKVYIDANFAELIEDINLANYYTVDQAMEKFDMSKQNLLTFVSQHKIPRITRGRTVYYSKVHLDTFKRKGEGVDVNWYSYAEIMENYGLTKDQVSYYIKHEHLKTEKRGKFTMIYRTDFDEKVVAVRFANAERDEDGKIKFPTQSVVVPKSTPAHPVDYTPEAPEGHYSTEEVSKKYALTPKHVHNLCRQHKVPTIKIKSFNFYEKTAIDALFESKNQYEDVKEWITPEQMREVYSMTKDACSSFIHRHQVPTKVEYGKTFYSKTHIDKIKGLVFDGMEDYYSVPAAMEKYGITRDMVFYYAYHYKVTKVRFGQFAFFKKDEFDKTMEKKNETTDEMTNSDK